MIFVNFNHAVVLIGPDTADITVPLGLDATLLK
jgi:hypothetical protein